MNVERKPFDLEKKYTLYIGTAYTWRISGIKNTVAKNAEEKEMALTTITFSIRDFEIYTIYTSMFQCENNIFKFQGVIHLCINGGSY